MNLKLKMISGAAMLVAAAAAQAGPFYMNIGTDYGDNTPGGAKVCVTCTSMKQEFTFLYQSKTTIFDTANTAANQISAGDLLTTDAGLNVTGDLSKNQFNGFNPNETLNNFSNNGYGTDWLVTFKISGLAGQVTGVTGAGVPTFAYGPGLLELFVTKDGVNFNNFMDIKISGGGSTGVSTILMGDVDFTAVDAGYNNLVNSGDYSCGSSSGFYDIWANCGAGALKGIKIGFESSFDTNVLVSQFQYNAGSDTFTLTSNHDGSGTFNVPEPGTLALAGLALIGVATARRRKA